MTRALLSVLFSFVFVLLVACGGGSSFEGEWSVDKAAMKEIMIASMEKEAEGQPEEAKKFMQDMASSMVENMKMDLVILKDGTFTVTSVMMDQTDTIKGKWTESGGTISMVEDENPDKKATAKIEDGKLMVSFQGEPGAPDKLPMIRKAKK